MRLRHGYNLGTERKRGPPLEAVSRGLAKTQQTECVLMTNWKKRCKERNPIRTNKSQYTKSDLKRNNGTSSQVENVILRSNGCFQGLTAVFRRKEEWCEDWFSRPCQYVEYTAEGRTEALIVDSKLGRIWKGAVINLLRHYPGVWLHRQRKTVEILR
jgi:hypothetical protein